MNLIISKNTETFCFKVQSATVQSCLFDSFNIKEGKMHVSTSFQFAQGRELLGNMLACNSRINIR